MPCRLQAEKRKDVSDDGVVLPLSAMHLRVTEAAEQTMSLRLAKPKSFLHRPISARRLGTRDALGSLVPALTSPVDPATSTKSGQRRQR